MTKRINGVIYTMSAEAIAALSKLVWLYVQEVPT
nr:MAG TPA: hypothetical protein [Caudoviricetes sp.]